MNIQRKLTEIITKSRKSILLLGPRQTGKSTLVTSLAPGLSINLAKESTFLEFASDPSALESQIKQQKPTSIFIDEVQRLPSLLNTVQALIDESRGSLRFYLTGSSARKLRRGKANLLPGRVLSLELGPLLQSELAGDFDLNLALSIGTLPGIYTDLNHSDRERTLLSYAGTYLKEEIQAEALTKDLEGFARFLRYCAANASQYLDMSKLANDSQIKRASAIRFFEILEDTMIAIRCDAFAKSERRRLVQHPRYFFFDNGVLNGVLGNFNVSADRRGGLFEHLVFTQIYHHSQAHQKYVRISNYRTEHHAELDLIIEHSNGDVVAVECKASKNVGQNDLRGFKSFANYYKRPHRKMVIYLGTSAKQVDDVVVLPFQQGISEIFRES
jgi:predicted AAA+ superfamily ATPase